jgi:hypothetical protein
MQAPGWWSGLEFIETGIYRVGCLTYRYFQRLAKPEANGTRIQTGRFTSSDLQSE